MAVLLEAPNNSFVEAFERNGYAYLLLDPWQIDLQAEAQEQIEVFNDIPQEDKDRHLAEQRNVGYREFGNAYADSKKPEDEDKNDSLIHWWSRIRMPAAELREPLLTSLEAYRIGVCLQAADMMVSELAELFDFEPSDFPYDTASLVQFNCFNRLVEIEKDASGQVVAGEFLQQAHNDEVCATLICTWQKGRRPVPGLEILHHGKVIPVETEPGQLIVMPGSIYRLMMGLEDPHMNNHQARNRQIIDRNSLMYFMSPDRRRMPGGLIKPFVESEHNKEVNIGEAVMEGPATFGLKEGFFPDLTPEELRNGTPRTMPARR